MWSRENTCKRKNCKQRKLTEPDKSKRSTRFIMPGSPSNTGTYIFKDYPISDYCFWHNQEFESGVFEEKDKPKLFSSKFWKKKEESYGPSTRV